MILLSRFLPSPYAVVMERIKQSFKLEAAVMQI